MWLDLEKYVSPEANGELYTSLRSDLDRQINRYDTYLEHIAGDIDKIIEEPSHAELLAADGLTETVPTTLPGLLAVLSYVHAAAKIKDGVAATFDENNSSALRRSLAIAARAISRQHA